MPTTPARTRMYGALLDDPSVPSPAADGRFSRKSCPLGISTVSHVAPASVDFTMSCCAIANIVWSSANVGENWIGWEVGLVKSAISLFSAMRPVPVSSKVRPPSVETVEALTEDAHVHRSVGCDRDRLDVARCGEGRAVDERPGDAGVARHGETVSGAGVHGAVRGVLRRHREHPDLGRPGRCPADPVVEAVENAFAGAHVQLAMLGVLRMEEQRPAAEDRVDLELHGLVGEGRDRNVGDLLPCALVAARGGLVDVALARREEDRAVLRVAGRDCDDELAQWCVGRPW